jgi:hypothetical protein
MEQKNDVSSRRRDNSHSVYFSKKSERAAESKKNHESYGSKAAALMSLVP